MLINLFRKESPNQPAVSCRRKEVVHYSKQALLSYHCMDNGAKTYGYGLLKTNYNLGWLQFEPKGCLIEAEPINKPF